MQPEMHGLHSKGAYRSLMVGSRRRVIQPSKGEDVKGSAPLSYTIDEEGGGGDLFCYSNYDFAKVRRELDVISPDIDTTLPATSKYNAPQGYTARDESGPSSRCKPKARNNPPFQCSSVLTHLPPARLSSNSDKAAIAQGTHSPRGI